MKRLKEGKVPCFLLFFLLFMSMPSAQAKDELYYFQVDGRYDYRTELLKLALSYTELDSLNEGVTLQPEGNIPTARATYLMSKNKIRGIVSLATSHEREDELLAIKIPIMAGILGMRVFLIHQEKQEAFTRVQHENQLKQYVAGFGEHWGDLAILKENGIPVLPVAKYSSLFDMLNAQRFDYFPRGVNEIYKEHETYGQKFPSLSIEKSLAVYYPYPVYFFVSKQDVLIAKRIELGLKKALADGQFKRLFLQYHGDLLTKLDFENRKIFNLRNDSLPEDARIQNMDWWLDTKSRIE